MSILRDRARCFVHPFKRWWLTLLVAGCLPQLASANLRVFEETAIPFTGFLSKAEFDKRYPGESVADPSKLDPGWYVIYEHNKLNYYFGPILLESTGQDYLVELEGIVEAAAAQRECIKDYRLELSYEPSATAAGSGGGPSAGGGSQPSGRSGSSGTEGSGSSGSPGIWDFFRRLFGWF